MRVNDFKRVVYLISRVLNVMAMWALVIILVIMIIGISLRQAGIATLGFFDINVIFGAIVAVFGWAHTQVEKHHLHAEILVSRLSQRVRLVVDSITHILCVVWFFIVSWYSISYTRYLWDVHAVYSTQVPMPLSIIAGVISLVFIIVGIVFLIDAFSLLARAVRK